MKVSKRTLRQINNTKDIYDYDMFTMTCTITFNYDTPEDMIDPHLSTPEVPCISDDFIDYVCQTISEVPKDFKVNFALRIKDYQNYDHDILLKSLKISVEETFYYYDEERKKDNVLSILFIIIGILALAINIIGQGIGLFGEKEAVSTQIIESLFDIVSWVFIWEGGAILFLTYENESTSFRKEFRRLNAIIFEDDSGKTLSHLSADYFYESGVKLSKKERFSRNFILFSNALLLSLTCIGIVEFIAKISFYTPTQILYTSVFFLLCFLLTITDIQFYKEKGILRKYALPLAIILFICTIAETIVNISAFDFLGVKAIILNIVLAITLLINIACIIFLKKQNVKVDE